MTTRYLSASLDSFQFQEVKYGNLTVFKGVEKNVLLV